MQFCNRPSLRLSFQLGRRQHQPSLAPNQKESWAWFHSWILCSSWSKRQMENLDITPLSWDFWGILFPFPWFPNINVWKFGLKMGNAISHSGPQRKWSGHSFIWRSYLGNPKSSFCRLTTVRIPFSLQEPTFKANMIFYRLQHFN